MSYPDPIHHFLVDRTDLRSATWRCMPGAPLLPGQVRLRLDRFALTANNITYALFGDKLRYWDFFPAPAGFGRMPVWGFADIVESQADGLSVGERIYGFFPISTELVVSTGDISPSSFSDHAPWRLPLSAVYNRYLRVTGDAAFAGSFLEALQAVFRPLFATSFLIDGFLKDQDYFGARTILISSASAKTSLALGFLLRRRQRVIEILGLTTAANVPFVSQTGFFDHVVDYADIEGLPTGPALFIDMAGSATLRARIHHHFGDDLRHSCAVGSSHWEDPGRASGLPGPRPVVFFAPGHVDKSTALWGLDGYEQRLRAAWTPFCDAVASHLEITACKGADEIEALYHAVLEGRLSPRLAAVADMAS